MSDGLAILKDVPLQSAVTKRIITRIGYKEREKRMNRNAGNQGENDAQSVSRAEKNRQLFLRQKKLLDLFLEKGAISRAQHDKSLHDLREKMGMDGMDGSA